MASRVEEVRCRDRIRLARRRGRERIDDQDTTHLFPRCQGIAQGLRQRIGTQLRGLGAALRRGDDQRGDDLPPAFIRQPHDERIRHDVQRA